MLIALSEKGIAGMMTAANRIYCANVVVTISLNFLNDDGAIDAFKLSRDVSRIVTNVYFTFFL